MVADPGFALSRQAIAEGIRVEAIPGASAVLTALLVSGLPTDAFFFAGFAPSQSGPRKRFLEGLRAIPATLVIYETPRRIERFLNDAVNILGPTRPAAICRELTKKFEEVRRMSLGELQQSAGDFVQKGECVVVIGQAETDAAMDEEALAEALLLAMKRVRLKEAVDEVASNTGAPRRQVYQLALALQRDGAGGGDR